MMMTRKSKVVFVIMAGGSGERLWPLVRSETPKACVSVDGTRTLLEDTVARLRPMMRQAGLFIVTTARQVGPIRRVLPAGFRRSLLVEPQAKNTAACIALAAAVLATRRPVPVMAVLPADHWIRPTGGFLQSLRAAIEVAQDGDRLVTIGVRPTRVHPGLGHLCVGPLLEVRHGCRVCRLARFVEKPSPQVAQRLLRQGQTYWNAGMFIGRVTTFLELIRRWLPRHARLLFPLGELRDRSAFARQAQAVYQKLRGVSFDDGVMAHLKDGCVVEGRFGWEDLGSWDSFARISQIGTPALGVASRNVQVVSPDSHLVATVGLNDAIVVHTPDATLICRTNNAQAVRTVVSRLTRDRRFSRYL